MVEPISFEKVLVGDALFVSTEANKKGEVLHVTKTENWKTATSHFPECGLMYKVTLENSDTHFGWAKRFLKKLVDKEVVVK